MGYVSFGDSGYEYYSDHNELIFSTDDKHNELFEFIFKDISCLPKLFHNYISKKMNLVTFEISEDKENKKNEDLDEIKKFLVSLHPYYKMEWKKEIVLEIGKFFNLLIVYSDRRKGDRDAEKFKNKEWYINTISGIMPDFASEFRIDIDYNNPEYFFEQYMRYTGEHLKTSVDDEVFSIAQHNMPIGFSKEIRMQKILYNALFFILDIDANKLNTLTKEQRIWLYSNNFIIGDSDPEIKAKRKISFRKYNRNEDQQEHYNNDSDKSLLLFNGFEVGCDKIPADMVGNFNSAIEYVKTKTPKVYYEEYEIFSITDLLYLEIESLIRTDTMVRRCKNCGKYFVINDRKVTYCDRPDQSGKICSTVGSIQTFRNKMDNDSALKIYNRAYKTHHARYKKGKMEKDELSVWREEAKQKLEEVRNGKLDISIFEEWLKK